MTALTVRICLGCLGCLSALILAVPQAAMAALTDYPFRVVMRATGNDYLVSAVNDGPAPISVVVNPSGENFASDRIWPVTAIVPPFTTVALARARAKDRDGAPFKHRFVYSYHYGRLDAAHDDATSYRLPFADGQEFMVSQGHGGVLTTHNDRASMNAVDFDLPLGSAVLAARAGVVVDVTLHHRDGGNDIRLRDKANTVSIVHDDGTVAEYAHLAPGVPLVTLGQRVNTGDLLAYSGNTGYSTGPHLHFSVSRPVVNDGKVSRESLPVLFWTDDSAQRFQARTGTSVRASYGASAANAVTPAPDLKQKTSPPTAGAGSMSIR